MFRNLHIFMLSENLLSSLPQEVLSLLSSLSSLSLDHNRITSLPSTLFTNCLNLQDLALNNNQLEKVKRIVYNCRDLPTKNFLN
jgi:Leucine-rich repeat (LRR) protein